MSRILRSMARILSLCIMIFLSTPAISAETSDRFMIEAQNILDQIKLQNKYRNGYVSMFLGLMQISTPQGVDPIKLNSESMVPVLGLEGDLRVWNEWGFTFKFTHAQNMLLGASADSPNTSSSYQQMLEACMRYKFILDETSVKNFVLLKFGTYTMANNFITTDSQLSYMKSMNGVMLGVERSIPATPQFDIKGGLDIFYNFDSVPARDVNNENEIESNKSGTGFQFKGEVYYNFKMFGAPARWGGAYDLAVFYNRLLNQQDQNKTSLVQSYRTLSTILSIVY